MLWRQTKQAREIGSSVCVGGAGRTQQRKSWHWSGAWGEKKAWALRTSEGRWLWTEERASAKAPRRHLLGLFEGGREVSVAGAK